MNGECEVSVSRCGRGSHRCADKLESIGVAELKNIVFHDKAKGFGEGIGGDTLEATGSAVNVHSYFTESFVSAYVSIHADCIGFE